MAKPVFRYRIGFGLPGCLWDSECGNFEGTTRREFVAMIRDALEFYDMPKSLIRQIRVRRAWDHIKRRGSSSAHFSIQHGHNVLEFAGLTEDEYNEARELEDC